MITELDLDRVLASWLVEGTERAHPEDVAAALRQVERTRQRHRRRGWRRDVVLPLRAGRSWLMAAVALGIVIGTWSGFGGASQRVVSASITAADFPWAAANPAPDTVAFVAQLPANAPEGTSWRAATYDRFELDRWTQSDLEQTSVRAGQPLLGTSAERQPDAQTATFTVTVRPKAFEGSILVSPGTPVGVDADAVVREIGAGGWLASIQVPDRAAYTVTARSPRLGDPTVVTGDLLRQASRVPPPQLVDGYTAVPEGALGPAARRLLSEILASTPYRDPYDLAVAVETYLKDPANFTYSTQPAGCIGGSLVECFAQTRTGYCMHYATTMAVLLRAALPGDPIPTRLVQGFLPGQRSNGTETVATRLAHAWVEVYFQGYGWIPFDPTGGSVGRPSTITDRAPVAAP